MSDLVFDIATIDDLYDVSLIENEAFIEPYKASDLLYEISENPLNTFLLAKKSGVIVGFLDYMVTFNSATINQIAVKKAFRREGIAKALLNEMFNRFPKDIDDVVETVTLEVRVSNEAALKLYESVGFEKVLVKKNYYKDGEDAAYMIKRIL